MSRVLDSFDLDRDFAMMDIAQVGEVTYEEFADWWKARYKPSQPAAPGTRRTNTPPHQHTHLANTTPTQRVRGASPTCACTRGTVLPSSHCTRVYPGQDG